jgi:hypothetical protein
MSTLHEGREQVQCGDQDHGCPLTDRAWLLEEAQRYERLSDPTGRPSLAAVCARALRALYDSMRFHGHNSARQHVACPDVPDGPADLEAAALPPGGFGRQSPFAGQLGAEAAWHLHLDTNAGRLAAWHLMRVAALAEEWGSLDAADHLDLEAAWGAAMEAFADEAGVPW